ncbi:MAG TPA: class I SAM-dependent methyltransferase [Jatrophihabitantaceae bacterium]|nr:class I SAM-dependent methyltransferase [Jatrophihabitantaceae bacterium]
MTTRLRRLGGRVARTLRIRPPVPVVRTGVVEEFTRSLASGWVAAAPGTPSVTVTLAVNGFEVARTRATVTTKRRHASGTVLQFRFVLKDLWHYVGPKDRIAVRAGGQVLPIVGHGTHLAPPKRGAKSLEELRAALQAGSVFSRMGRLQQDLRLNTAWLARATALAEEVRGLIAERFGYEVFFAYGSLLGAVREHGPIGHDDDLDLGYLSARRVGSEVGVELHDIALALIEVGYQVEPFPPLLHIYTDLPDGGRQRVDLFPHHFDEAGLLQVSWGMAGDTHVRLNQWRGVHEVPFGTQRAPVPVAAEEVLAQLYGASWREPQPGFSWYRDRTEKPDDLAMSWDDCDEVYWADYYRRSETLEPSPFCRELIVRPDCPELVFDLGCGDGRDSLGFAEAGRRVIGVDRSAAALHRARELAGGRSVSFVQCDLLDTAALSAALDRVDGKPALSYLRFVLHGYLGTRLEELFGSVGAIARTGDLLALEFRDVSDSELPKVHASAHREFVDGAALANRLAEWGWTVLEHDCKTGRSPYRSEDPALYRIVARRVRVTDRA